MNDKLPKAPGLPDLSEIQKIHDGILDIFFEFKKMLDASHSTTKELRKLTDNYCVLSRAYRAFIDFVVKKDPSIFLEANETLPEMKALKESLK